MMKSYCDSLTSDTHLYRNMEQGIKAKHMKHDILLKSPALEWYYWNAWLPVF